MHGIALKYFLEVAQAGSLSGASERPVSYTHLTLPTKA